MNNKRTILHILSLSLFALFAGNDAFSQVANPGHSIGTVTDNYHFQYNQVHDQLVELQPAAIPNTGLDYQWQKSFSPYTGFSNISGATSSSYTPATGLTQTTYYRRRTTKTHTLLNVFSNIIKISVVSSGWEDINYVREYSVRTTGITTWQAVDQLPIGPKLQTTSYSDGMNRSLETISRETAVPASGTLWGDVVQFSQYDAYGRQTVKYLPYTTTTQSGKYKGSPLSEQPTYYTQKYNETSAYSTRTFDNSPLDRPTNIKSPGTSWAAGNGNSLEHDHNSTADDVQAFKVDYIQGNPPVYVGPYAERTLYKISTIDESGKKVVEFINRQGQLILKKVQLDNSPGASYTGWICSYFVYDEFDKLRYQIQPEGVNYLAANSWSFAGTNGQKILAEQCYQYNYDDKGRLIWEKSPGAAPLNMIYDKHDRLVFRQDGNQATLSTPQWTVNLYDELSRPVAIVLYNTTKTITDLKTDLVSAATTSTYTITNVANNGGSNITINLSFSPLSSTNLNSSSTCVVLKYMFYDNYSYPGVKSFNTGYTNLSAYSTSDPDVMPIAASDRILGMPTGSKTRVLGSNTFLSSTNYYDDRGHDIQVLEDNIKSGTDIFTMQRHFDARVISTCSDHTTSGTGYTNFKILTKYILDKLGRVTALQKQFGSNAFKTISEYEYDDMGMLKKKILDPDYTTGGNDQLESLEYSYNIHNHITGINKDYALKTNGVYDKWEHFFGLYLGYDNRDNVFAAANLQGQVTGQLWNTQGDDAQRRYNYTYDNAGRLVNAAFTEKKHPGDSWSNGQIDFSVSGTGGKITYDLNSNLLNMLHKGVIPGNTAPETIDNLTYSYGTSTYSNKLQSVTDQMTATAVNGLSGDVKDGANGSNPDYVYDVNGNVIIDLNKNIQSLNGGAPGTNGISYNFLDKPELIRIVGKGTVRIVYNADGEKLQRAFIPDGSGASVITTYINGYVYQETATITTSTTPPLGGTPSLSSINFEEGRVRVITPVNQYNGLDLLSVDGNMDLPNSKEGVYDFFIMDYQHNIRMILTEEVHSIGNACTMETSRETLEEGIFGQPGSANEVENTRYPTPQNWVDPAVDDYVSQVGTNSGNNIGPNTLQRVMAGDKVTATALYYFTAAPTGNNTSFPATVLGSIASAIGVSTAPDIVKNNVTAITTQLNNTTDFINAIQPAGSNPSGSTPQAYLTLLFFDERFNLIPAADGGVYQMQVDVSLGVSGDALYHFFKPAPKNGYVFAYLSNQSNEDVYFDNFSVQITSGNIIEENHYYSYGLKISAISSKKLGNSNEGTLKNNYLYHDKEFFDDGDLNWYDYGFRNYDPQIGRFMQLDPIGYMYPFYTPYQFAGCEPIANVDLDGLEPESAIAFANSLRAQGFNPVMNFVSSGKYANRWTVSWLNAANIGDVMVFAPQFIPVVRPLGIPLGNMAAKSAAIPYNKPRPELIMMKNPTDYLGGSSFNRSGNPGSRPPTEDELKGPDVAGTLGNFGAVNEHGEVGTELLGRMKLGKTVTDVSKTMSPVFGTFGNAAGGFSLGYNLYKKDYKEAGKDAAEIGIGFTPYKYYYYAGKTIYWLSQQEYFQSQLYVGYKSSLSGEIEELRKCKDGTAKYERISKRIHLLQELMQNIEKKFPHFAPPKQEPIFTTPSKR